MWIYISEGCKTFCEGRTRERRKFGREAKSWQGEFDSQHRSHFGRITAQIVYLPNLGKEGGTTMNAATVGFLTAKSQ